MNELARAKIRDIKVRVSLMLEERRTLSDWGGNFTHPSEVWSDACSNFDYLQALPEEYFAKLRMHTHHLTSDSPNYGIHDKTGFAAAEFVRRYGLQELTRGIPRDLVLDEPPGGIGIMLDDGRFVSSDSVRYQKIVNTLYRQGIIDALRPPAKAARSSILEIGGGYGAVAHHLSNISGNTTYVIVDLPECFLFSAPYLTLLNDTKKLYLYNQADFSSFIDSSEARSYDFILIPNYRLEALRRWTFDLALNTASFQEMSEEQVAVYLDFICDTCKGVLYSQNKDSFHANTELRSLNELLRARFALRDVASSAFAPPRGIRPKFRHALKSIAMSLGILNRLRQWGIAPRVLHPWQTYCDYICTPLRPSTLA
jgi:putative sugar O-methyltransferase